MINLIRQYLGLESLVPIIRTIVIVVVIYITLKFVFSFVKRSLLRRAVTKRQQSNVKIFSRVLNYIIIVLLIIFAISSYSGSWAGLGIGVGLFSAALGWALQRPITGMAAWIMIITKRPFEIGDRIVIGDTKGDVVDISLTHVHLSEVGGTVASEEPSGRVVLIPNSILFEQKIINYTFHNDFILDEAVTLITYESNLEKAKDICLKAALKFLDLKLKEKNDLPYIRVSQTLPGIEVKVRYKVRASKRIEVLSNISSEIISNIPKTKDVKIMHK